MVGLNKIISSNRVKHTCRLLFLLTLFMLSTNVMWANKTPDNCGLAYGSTKATASEIDTDSRRVYDEAKLLDAYEIEELEALSHEYGENAGIEIFILTHNDSRATYPEKYIEDYEDQFPIGDRVYFLYDVYGKEIFMQGYGLAETYIHSKRIDKVYDNVENKLKNKNYYDAFKTYITMSAGYMEDDSELNYDHEYIYDNTPEGFDPDNEYVYDNISEGLNHDNKYYDYQGYYDKEELLNSIFLNFWFQLAAALIIGGVVVASLAYRSSGRMTAGARDYLDKSRQGLIGRRDHYLRSTVTRWRKPTQNTSSQSGGRGSGRGGFNSGGFRGGRSAGGRSHSSGGRKL